MREWQEGLRALLPNINISFGTPTYNSNSSNAGGTPSGGLQNHQASQSLTATRSNPLPIQTQNKGEILISEVFISS